jgi:hypothetical protein
MDTETAPPAEENTGILKHLRDGCLGELVGLLVFVVFAFLGWPIANAIGIPKQENAKDALVVYGGIGMAAGALFVFPIWLVVRAISRRRRSTKNQPEKTESHGDASV